MGAPRAAKQLTLLGAQGDKMKGFWGLGVRLRRSAPGISQALITGCSQGNLAATSHCHEASA